MTKTILQRLFFSCIRFVGVAAALVLLVEVSFCVLGGSSRHVFERSSYQTSPEEFSAYETTWGGVFSHRSFLSFRVVGIVYLAVLLIGYGWGILSARFRRYKAVGILSLPFEILACVPAFWIVIMVAIYSYTVWKRPGFADEIMVESGPDIVGWWHAMVVAVPLICISAGWQIRAVSGAITKEVSRPFIRGLYLGGYDDETIFYRHALRGAFPVLVALADRTVPCILGGLIAVEYAFHFPGMGSLLIEGIKSESYEAIFLSGFWILAITSVLAWIRRCVEKMFPMEVTHG